MIHQLNNGKSVHIRLLKTDDGDNLFNYLQNLSPESRSRFGPHPFDRETINTICWDKSDNIIRYVATDLLSEQIIAYMLIKPGMIEWDEKRYADRNQFFNNGSSVSFAPSVADAWQSSGLGSVMNNFIESDLRAKGINRIILWGGVQATNEKAVNFYKKHGYSFITSFWHDEKDNYDMMKVLT